MAYDTEGYGKVANPFWDLPEEGGGGGSDIPDFPQQRNFFLKTARQDGGAIGLEWESFPTNVREILYPMFEAGDEYVGKVFTKYGTGYNDHGWINAQAAYTDYANTNSGLSATTVQAAIDELAQNSGGGGHEISTKSAIGNGMTMGISEMVDVVDAEGNFNLESDIEVSVMFGKIDDTDPIMPKIPSPVAEWSTTISKNFIKEIYDGWVDAGKASTYWSNFNQIKKGSETSMVTIFDMVDGSDQAVGLYNKDIIMPLQLMFSEGIYGMCVFITPNPYALTKDANSGNPIFSEERQASNNYGMQAFVRRTYITPYL